MKRLREFILEQVASGRLAKDEAAGMLADLLRAQNGRQPAGSTDIAIIGMACRFPPASDLDGFWASLVAGADLIGAFPASRRKDIDALVRLLAEQSPAIAGDLAGEYFEAAFLEHVDQFDHTVFKIAPAEACLIDPQQRLMLEVVLECLEHAGYRREKLNGSKTGVYMAYSDADYERLVPPDEPSAVHATLPAMIAGRISYLFNLLGPSQVVETTCSSSLLAVHNACQGIISGDCEMALAGGVRLMLFPFASGYAGSQQLGISSPDGYTRTFDDAGNGTGSGEGAAVILLKPLAKAIADRDYIHAVIKGSAINSDGKSSSVTAPNPEAQARVIAEAWRRANIDPETITYIEAHGTATKLGDPIEIEGITSAFRQYTERKGFCAVGSVKTNMGHLSGAAGIAGLIKTVLALQHRQIPASLHFNKPNALINFADSPVFVNHRLRAWDVPSGPRRAGVSSFGVTGTNCHVVLEEYARPGDPLAHSSAADQNCLFTLSATQRTSLAALLDKYVCFLASPMARAYQLSDICYTANAGRDTYACRLAIIARSVEELQEKLAWTAEYLRHEAAALAGDPIYYGVVERQEEPSLGKTGTLDAGMAPAEAAALYIRAARISWDAYYAGQTMAKVPLPTYAFERQRCWIAPETRVQSIGAQLRLGLGGPLAADRAPQDRLAPQPEVESNKTSWLYTLRWHEQPLVSAGAGPSLAKGTWLILTDELGLGGELADRIEACGCETVRISPGRHFKHVQARQYQVDPTSQEDWRRLLQELSDASQLPTGLVHLWTCTATDEAAQSSEQFRSQQDVGVFSLFAFLQQAVEFQVQKPFEIWIVSNYVAEVIGTDERLFPEKVPLWGLSKVIPQEYFWAQCYCLDVATIGQERAAIADRIFTEMSQELSRRDYIAAYRRDARFTQQVERLDLAQFADRERPVIKEGGVYLLAGGAGRIGLGIGRYLAQQARVTLILVNRSELPPRQAWRDIIASSGPGDTIARRLAGITAIEQLGSEVVYFAADIGDHRVMARVIETVVARYGRINGVINATMEVKRKKLAELSQAEFESSVLNRMRGARTLDEATHAEQPDFFIIISSISSIFGGAAQGDDVCANMFLDVYGAWMRRAGRGASVLNLPGIQQSRTAPTTIAEQVLPPISADDLAELFDLLIKKKTTFAFIEDFNFKEIKPLLPVLRVRFAQSLLAEQPAARPAAAAPGVASAPGRPRFKGKGRDAHYTETELRIAEVWLNVLGYAEISIDDNFFDLGGDSLMAIRVLQGIRAALDTDLDITDIFEYPTIAGLVGRVEARLAARGAAPSRQDGAAQEQPPAEPAPGPPPSQEPQALRLAPISRDQDLVLSFAQQQLWFLEQLEPGDPVNNIAVALRIVGRLDLARFMRSINAIIQRHEILRTTFAAVADRAVQVIIPAARFRPRFGDLRALAAPDRASALQRLALADALLPFDLAHGPLLRATLLMLDDGEHVIVLTVHHIVFDGWSMGLFIQELAAFYEAFAAGDPTPLPPLPIQYADFAHWQRQRLQGQALEEQIAYWKKRLSDAPVLELPADYPRPQTLAFQGQNQPLALSPTLSQELRDLSQRENVTLFMTLLAAYLSLLHLYTGRDDLVIGAFSAQRNTPEIKKLIGLFVNTLILRVDLSGNPSFRDVLARVRDVVLEASTHQDLTFEQILEVVRPKRNFSRVPLIRVVFDFHINPMQDVRFHDLAITPIGIDKHTARWDLNLELTDKGEDGLSGQFEYNTHLFKPATIARMAKQFTTFLQNIAVEPDLKI